MNPLQKIQYWYRWLFKPHFLAGERAEQPFEQLSELKGYVVEKIPQDKDSFGKYANNSQNRIKRGDFLVRNLKNLEVEVKCFTKRRYRATECYAVAYSHIKKHEKMVNLTGEPVIFAIFERDGRDVVKNSLKMIPLTEGSILDFEDKTGARLLRLYISGDTLLIDELQEIPRRFPDIDIGLFHLGGTRVLGILVSMDDEQGVEAVKLINPDTAIPIHYNDYDVFKSPLEDFKLAAEKAGLTEKMVYLAHGDTHDFQTRTKK